MLVNGRIVIPVGSYVAGTVTQIKKPGRMKGRGELYVRFDTGGNAGNDEVLVGTGEVLPQTTLPGQQGWPGNGQLPQPPSNG